MSIKYTNDARTTLAANLSAVATSMTVSGSALFPTLGSGEYTHLTLTDATDTLKEIVKCTAIDGNIFTIVRGEESTTARSYIVGDNVQLRITAGLLGAAILEGNYSHPANHAISVISGLQTALDAKLDASVIPEGAVYTDTIYSPPAYKSISYITGLQTALNSKVDDAQVLTDVPADALFTDTIYSPPAYKSITYITGLQTALDSKANASQVLTDVPSGAVFTDTVYSLPSQTGNAGKVLKTNGTSPSWVATSDASGSSIAMSIALGG